MSGRGWLGRQSCAAENNRRKAEFNSSNATFLSSPVTPRAKKDHGEICGLDASHVTWLLTANELDPIPAPLQSRMRVFEIPELTKAQKAQIVQAVYKEVVSEYPRLELASCLDDDVVHALSAFSPREMRTVTRSLVANAVLSKRRTPQLRDVPDAAILSTTKIGFM
jgi:ATP-dependent Lon protease